MIFLILLLVSTIEGNRLIGEPHYCSHEGDQVKVDRELLGVDSCLMCYCKNHMVQCNASNCPPVEGCYRLHKRRNTECCHTCMGCMYGGHEIAHDHAWYEGCRRHECQASVLTSSDTQCLIPCANPLPPAPGDCCPRCSSCWLEGRRIAEGTTASPRHDPCVKCLCSGGQLTCSKRSCPVLLCPPHRAIPGPDGCCPVCNGSREIFAFPGGSCFLGRLYGSGQNGTFDKCTSCSCHEGFLHCERKTCPPFQCSEQYRKGSDLCCPECEYPARSQVCMNNGIVREHGDTWKHDRCSTCRCEHGQITCQVDDCEYANKECPVGFRKEHPVGECCPNCIEEPGVCITYGDPHYKTFDNYQFNFQGECRYELAKDCTQGTFAVRVNNDARRSSYFSWTRSLSIKIVSGQHKFKVSLGQKLRTKVDRKKVRLPFTASGMNITRDGYLVTVDTEIGVQINWDGASYVEVKVDPSWNGRTCGLCGNFNHNPLDDRRTRKGSAALSDETMAISWQSGKTRDCSQRHKRLRLRSDQAAPVRTQRLTCLTSPKEANQRCDKLNHTLFDACRAKVSVDSFYNSCLLDMCECPSSRTCECDAFIAYVRECERTKVDVSAWRSVTKCGGFTCPYGSLYMDCAPACRPSCRNPKPNPECYMRRCRSGCYCPYQTVLYKGSCIHPNKCPRKKRKGRNT